MSSKYQDHPFPPCRFEQYPQNPNIYFYPHCREWYDIHDVTPSLNWLLLIIAAIILILMNVNSGLFKILLLNLAPPLILSLLT